MIVINRDLLIPYMNAYKNYYSLQNVGKNDRALRNEKEEYKRGIVEKAVRY